MKVLLHKAPPDYFNWLEAPIDEQLCTQGDSPDLIHIFAKNRREFETAMQRLKQHWEKNTSTMIWISWYKKSSGIPTDINEDDIRRYALANGLVDVKVCAVTDQWSGLKLVVPRAKR